MATEPKTGPIFVIGSGRSGTSLLRSMLNAHPRIYLAQEASFIPWTVRLPSWVSPQDRLDFYFRTFSFAWLRLDPADVRARLPETLRHEDWPLVYRTLLQLSADRFDRPRYGEKNPVNTLHLESLFSAFPDACVIDVVRDPRGTIVSHTRMPFSTSSRLVLARRLVGRERRVHGYGERILRIRLEDLIADPRPVMERVLAFAGEPWSDRVLAPDDHALPDEGIPFPWLATHNGSRTRRRGWREILPPVWVRLIEDWNQELMERFGYPRAELDREPTRGQRIRAVLGEIPETLRYLRRISRSVGTLAKNRFTPAESQALANSANPAAWRANPHWQLPDPPRVPGPA